MKFPPKASIYRAESGSSMSGVRSALGNIIASLPPHAPSRAAAAVGKFESFPAISPSPDLRSERRDHYWNRLKETHLPMLSEFPVAATGRRSPPAVSGHRRRVAGRHHLFIPV
nr:hypothetical protein Iba_chr02aCG9600 [Ipomoea batatas]